MSYYPSSQIKSNLYTNGDEYALFTTKEIYKGYYYELANGRRYTGRNPQDKPNILLIAPIQNQVESTTVPQNYKQIITYEYPNVETDSIVGTYNPPTQPLPERYIPSFNQILPTPQDQQLGVFTRYFCKKNNELQYIEIDKTTYTQLKTRSPQIAWDLYTPVLVLWYLKGEKEKVFNTNKNLVSLIEQQDKWYGFSKYFKDQFLKYYLES
jgi:hypothetical protein